MVMLPWKIPLTNLEKLDRKGWLLYPLPGLTLAADPSGEVGRDRESGSRPRWGNR